MKKITCSALALAVSLAGVSIADARNTKHLLPISVALETKDADDKLSGDVRFFFGDQKTPAVVKKHGSDTSNRKTNAFNKTDEKACNWAFLSALVALEKKAKSLGANAVINITSYYDRIVMSSQTEFECHAGAIVAGVVLRGEYATVADK